MQQCRWCEESKALAEFHMKQGKRRKVCRDCVNRRARELHNSGRQAKVAANVRAHKVRRRQRIDQELKDEPCLDCGGSFHPCAMDFDHREGETKDFNLGEAARLSVSWERILAEVAKCDLVCACCHRLRTYQRIHGTVAQR